MSKRRAAKIDSTGKEPYQYDILPANAPGEDSGIQIVVGLTTRAMIEAGGKFSLGIFQWRPDIRYRTSGEAFDTGKLKRSETVRRVFGWNLCPRPAYQRARAIMAKLNGGEDVDE